MSLLVVDDRADTADVLAAVYETRGVQVTRIRTAAGIDRGRPGRAIFVMPQDDEDRAWPSRPSVVLTGGVRGDASRPVLAADGREPIELPPLFRFADLIAAIDGMLQKAA